MKRRFFYHTALAIALTLSSWAEDAPHKVGEFIFAETDGWKAQANTKNMVKLSFAKTGADEKTTLEANFYHFGVGQGGDIAGNIKRWEGMFTAQPAVITNKEEMAFGSRQATLVKISGSYKGSMFNPEPEPKADYMLVGAVLPSESEGDVFVRLVGPKAQVEPALESFKKLLLSAAPQ